MLTSERLTFCGVKADTDAVDFESLMLDERYWLFSPVEIPTPGSIQDFLRAREEDALQTPRTSYYWAVREAGGTFVGEAVIRVWNGVGDIGWGVRHSLTGRGYATEIARRLLRFGFDELGLHRVSAMCRHDNAASRRVMEKAGMKREGLLREHFCVRGEWWSSWLYAMLETD